MACFGIFACNQIVGVEDVRLRGTGSRPDITDNTGDAGTDPHPDPTKPVLDASADAGSGCAGAKDCIRHVFITSTTFTGKLGGLAGADALCYTAAQSSPALKGRVFRAWLSDATANAATRIPMGTRAFLRNDGSTFATSYQQLISGTISNTLNIDEQGNVLSGNVTVWTATDESGIYNGSSCNNWTSEAVTDSGAFGDSQATDGDWTQEVGEPIATGSCNSLKRLYCIEY